MWVWLLILVSRLPRVDYAELSQEVITQQECLLANQIGQKPIYYVTHPARHKIIN